MNTISIISFVLAPLIVVSVLAGLFYKKANRKDGYENRFILPYRISGIK